MDGMRFHVGNDHGGIELRHELTALLRELGHSVESETGPAVAGESVDYPDIAVAVCRRVLADEGAWGLLICGTGQGMAMTANRIPGIRAGVVSDVFSAKMIREHNDAHVLCLGQRVLGVELAKEILRAFTRAQFGGGRHVQRVAKMMRAADQG